MGAVMPVESRESLRQDLIHDFHGSRPVMHPFHLFPCFLGKDFSSLDALKKAGNLLGEGLRRPGDEEMCARNRLDSFGGLRSCDDRDAHGHRL